MTGLLALVTVGAMPVGAGVRVESAHATAFELTIRAALLGRTIEVGKQHDQVSEIDVRTSDASGPVRVELVWHRNHQTDHGPEGARSFDLPVAGRGYLVDRAAGSVTPRSGAATDEEVSIARSASELFAQLDALRAMIPTRELAIGDVMPTGPLFAGLIRDAPGSPVAIGTLTVATIVDGVMTLDLDVTIESQGELQPGVWAELRAPLSGVVDVAVATGWTTRLEVAGPVYMTGHASRFGLRIPLRGEGTFRSDTTLRFH